MKGTYKNVFKCNPVFRSMAKVLLDKSGKKFLVRETGKDLHTQFGFFPKKDLKKKNGKVKTNMGNEFSIFDAAFIDLYRKIKRDAQIIPLKDIGFIIAETGIGSKSKVVDAGAGSGALACFLANFVKEVTTYEIREDFIEIVRANIVSLKLKNIKIKNKDIYDGIDEKNADLVVLDLPEPWKAIESAEKALKPGGFLVSYSPTIPQVIDFVDAIKKNDNFAFLKACELTEREWDVEGRKVRPRSQAIGHSGFLSFARRL